MYDIFAQLCTERGVTPYRVSKDTGIATATLSDWKTGKSQPKADKMKVLAEYFGVSKEYLESGEENIPHQEHYTDPETAKIAEGAATNRKLRALFSMQCDMNPDEIDAFYNLSLTMHQKAERLDQDDPC